MSTAMTAPQVEQYYQDVRAALADLPPQQREDLLEDLAEHLGEVAAEGDGSLVDRLGQPATYAAELRTAAGLDGTGSSGSTRGDVRQSQFDEFGRKAITLAHQFDLRAGRLLGYARLADLLRAVRPGWWVVRGWLVADLIGSDHYGTGRAFPALNGNRLLGLILLIVAVGASNAFRTVVSTSRDRLEIAPRGRRRLDFAHQFDCPAVGWAAGRVLQPGCQSAVHTR